PVKFATATGACLSKNLHVIRPMLVSNNTVAPVGCGPICACIPGASGNDCEEAGAVCEGVCVWLVEAGVESCASTVPATRTTAAKRDLRISDIAESRLTETSAPRLGSGRS